MTRLALPLASVMLCMAIGTPVHAVEAVGAKKPAGRTQPARTRNAAPDRTGSIAKSDAEPRLQTPAAVPADEAPLTPFYLPEVARPRMHDCGETWHAKKMAGETGSDDWRDFAIKCLAGKDAPPSP